MSNKWQVRSHSTKPGETGDYDDYCEIVNERGDALRTSDGFEDEDLQRIVDALNAFPGELRMETACETTLHCDNMQLKMEIDQLKQLKDSPYQGSAGVWVKASERLPDKDGPYHTRYISSGVIYVTHYRQKGKSILRRDTNDVEWLDDSAASPAGEEAIEILKELCWLKSHKDAVGKDYLYNDRQPLAWQRANDFLNGLVKKEKL